MQLDLLWAPLVAATLAVSAALLTVLTLRLPVQTVFGARAAYVLWLLLPLALAALLLPAPTLPRAFPATGAWHATATTNLPVVSAPPAERLDARALLVCAWFAGLLLTLVVFSRLQLRFARTLLLRDEGGVVLRSQRADISPLVLGLWRTRVVLPADFEQRFDADEQQLVLRHEQVHLRRHDVRVNALATLLLALFWFHPLAWLGWRRFRFDQELACDALVVEQHPNQRRAYASAMLKAQLDPGLLPLGCHWSATHPLHRRISMLARKIPTTGTRKLGRTLVAVLGLALSYSIWAQKPATLPPLPRIPSKGDLVVMYEISVGSGTIRGDAVADTEGNGSIRKLVDGAAWEVEFQIKPKAPDRFLGAFQVKRDGKLLGHPTMEWLRDSTSSLRIANDRDQTQFAIAVRAEYLDEDPEVVEITLPDATARKPVPVELQQAVDAVDIIRQPDGSYRLDNFPPGLSPEDRETLMHAVLRETVRQNRGALPRDTFEYGDREQIRSGITKLLRSSKTGRISLGAKQLSVRNAFLAAAALAQLRVVDTTLLSTTQRVDFELNDVAPEVALSLIADASDPPFQYAVQDGAITLSR